MHSLSQERILQAYHIVREYLLNCRTPEGFWEGYLSSSALATATAISALSLAHNPSDEALIRQGLEWLGQTQNQDGGWGDTPESLSHPATTMLVVAALHLSRTKASASPLQRAATFLAARLGLTSIERRQAISRLYGQDRTFAVPILLNCALAELVEWAEVPPLPYLLALLPRGLYKFLRLQVVSYALPALIAVGLAIDVHQHPNGLRTRLRRLLQKKLLSKLQALQPASGGYLEATPLTAFVCMSLLSMGIKEHPVVRAGLRFLRQSVRADGSWPIDSNLSVWLTSLATGALQLTEGASWPGAATTIQWLRARQFTKPHIFTGAAPGGWGWSHLPGAVPDADDTSAALIALADYLPLQARLAGIRWLLDLQNADGGWPTFCRGWGQLPFDKSCADITAHALRALQRVRQMGVPVAYERKIVNGQKRGIAFLRVTQRSDGSWQPLWFGHQLTREQENSVLGTARVLLALAELEPDSTMAQRGLEYLQRAQNADGGWGGAPDTPSSVEETALAVSALTCWPDRQPKIWEKGLEYLLQRIEKNDWTQPTPIGLYFAKLWYAEQLYPVIWTVEAIARALKALNKLRI